MPARAVASTGRRITTCTDMMTLIRFMVVAIAACSIIFALEEALAITLVHEAEGRPQVTVWPANRTGYYHGDG